MLAKRLIAAACFITPVALLIWMDVNWNWEMPGIWLLPLAFVCSLLMSGELLAMLRRKTAGAISWVVYLGAVLCHLAVIVPNLFSLPADCPVNRWGWSCIALFAVLCLAFLNELLTYDGKSPTIERISLTVFSVLYCGWLLTFLSGMRVVLENTKGALAVFSVLFVIKMSDAGAYFVGKKLGRTKMAPLLSPGKTIEGLVGGLLAAVFAGLILFGPIEMWLPGMKRPGWLAIIGYPLTLAVVGVAGDLCESLIKREMGCKDSSAWLPGLGGIMDTSDSVVIAAPVAYLWWTTGLL